MAFGFLIRASSSLTRSTFGVFAIPVALTLAGADGDIALAFGLFSLMSGVSGPAAGRLIDRFGTRVVQRGGAVLLGLGLLFSALATAPWHYYVAMGVLCGVGMTAFTQVPVNILIARFVRRRLPAFGIVTAGAGVGALVAVPLTERIVALGGWRIAYLGYAAVVLLIWLPFDLWLRRALQGDEQQRGAEAEDGEQDAADRPAGAPAQPRKAADSPGQQRLSRAEIQLVTAGFFSGSQRTLVVAFFIPWALSRGYGTAVAAQAFGLAEGLRAFSGAGISMLGMGIGAKRTYVLCTLLATSSIAALLLSANGSHLLLFAAAVSYGVLSGGIHPASSSLQSMVYDASHLGLLFGSSAAAFGLGGAASVVAARAVASHFGGLDAVMVLIALGLIAMAVLVFGVSDPAARIRTPDGKGRQ